MGLLDFVRRKAQQDPGPAPELDPNAPQMGQGAGVEAAMDAAATPDRAPDVGMKPLSASDVPGASRVAHAQQALDDYDRPASLKSKLLSVGLAMAPIALNHIAGNGWGDSQILDREQANRDRETAVSEAHRRTLVDQLQQAQTASDAQVAAGNAQRSAQVIADSNNRRAMDVAQTGARARTLSAQIGADARTTAAQTAADSRLGAANIGAASREKVGAAANASRERVGEGNNRARVQAAGIGANATLGAARIGAESREKVAQTGADGRLAVAGEKLSDQEKNRADFAQNLNENLDQLEEIAKRRPDLLGMPSLLPKVLGGRGIGLHGAGTTLATSGLPLTGSNDPDVAALNQIKENLGLVQQSTHGVRSARGIEGAANSIINHWGNGPEAMLAAIQQARNSAGTFEAAPRRPGNPIPLTQQVGAGQPQIPAAAAAQLREGVVHQFANGQSWTLENGKPKQVSAGGARGR